MSDLSIDDFEFLGFAEADDGNAVEVWVQHTADGGMLIAVADGYEVVDENLETKLDENGRKYLPIRVRTRRVI